MHFGRAYQIVSNVNHEVSHVMFNLFGIKLRL